MKTYIAGVLLSGLAHLPLIKEREYGGFILATAAWPVTAAAWLVYLYYVTSGTYRHSIMVRDKNGCYTEITLTE